MKKYLPLIICALFCMLFTACMRENTLHLVFGKGIVKSDVDIKLIIQASDEVPPTQIFDGSNQISIPNDYGENDWFFVYKGKFKGHFRHFKTNRNHKHDYQFTFHQKNCKYYVDVQIEGADDFRWRIELK